MDKLTNAGFTGIRLQDYILESDGIHIIQNKGMPKKDGNLGNLEVHYKIVYPKILTQEQKNIFRLTTLI